MRKHALAALAVLLAACGGSDKPDPASRQFQYDAPTEVLSAGELGAIDAGEFAVADGAAFQADSAADPEAAAFSVIGLPDAMASEAWGATGYALRASAMQASALSRATASLGSPAAATAAGFDEPCVTVQTGLVTYSNCKVTLSPGEVVTVNGTISRSGPTISWKVDIGMSMSDTSYTVTATNRVSGSLTFGATTVKGQARSDTRVTVSGTGLPSMTAAYTTLADLDLQLAQNPFCVTGGTLELRRVWTERPAGMPTTGAYADQGLQFTWQGCGTVQVARSQ